LLIARRRTGSSHLQGALCFSAFSEMRVKGYADFRLFQGVPATDVHAPGSEPGTWQLNPTNYQRYL
jgi:hypothetical protein